MYKKKHLFIGFGTIPSFRLGMRNIFPKGKRGTDVLQNENMNRFQRSLFVQPLKGVKRFGQGDFPHPRPLNCLLGPTDRAKDSVPRTFKESD